ncbi:uncharacterized mitochondrial protein AtMg00240-like [Lycium barbarum]|uniref:uncharacterized mitochondrial protein AtMg00240-like n=1 Tax=Lycium barbarum TaxID=112863 RepID=UPI00293E68AD|nr:uncharacterized mitochondrial protein AtMg00240-like [Lycium barbarum]
MGLTGAKPAGSPLELNSKLTTAVFDQHFGHVTDPMLDDPTSYQRLIGQLLYLTNTRPDIAFAVQVLSQFMQSPKASYMATTLRVVKYIKQAPGLGLFLPAQDSCHLTAYCDADWASCPNTRKLAYQNSSYIPDLQARLE